MSSPKTASQGGRPRAAPATPLAEWIDADGRPIAEIADLLGVAVSYVNRLRRGESRPSLELAIRIEELTGGDITARSWVDN